MKIGCDILKVERIEKILKQKTRVFTVNEIEHCEKYVETNSHYAGLFCAKEAIIKALDIDNSYKFKYNELEILHKESGRPYVKFLGDAEKLFKNIKIDISISNEKEFAMATAITY
ncbi:MAG: holo-ACP synthase [Clostridia bacterium]|nr:holo-ACP synthase [Clostridia bacterium]